MKKILFLLMLLLPSVNGLMEYGEDWDRNCEDGICTLKIYMEKVYFKQSNGTWKSFENNLTTEGCSRNYYACVRNNLYDLDIKSSLLSNDSFKFTFKNESLTFIPLDLTYNNGKGNVVVRNISNVRVNISDNQAIYKNAFGKNTTLIYAYTPYKLKQYIVLEERLVNRSISENITLDYTFKFSYGENIRSSLSKWNRMSRVKTERISFMNKSNSSIFFIPQGIMEDYKGEVKNFDYELYRDNNELFITLKLPFDWLQNESTMYPVIIDPTVVLNATGILWDGFLRTTSNVAPVSYARFENNVNSFAGVLQFFVAEVPVYNTFRSAITWNISMIPLNSTIIDMSMGLTITQVGASSERTLDFYHMDGDNDTYIGNNTGNWNFFNDTGNGTLYLSQFPEINDGLTIFNFTNTTLFKDFVPRLRKGANNWSIGLKSREVQEIGALPTRWRASEFGNDIASLVIVYEPPDWEIGVLISVLLPIIYLMSRSFKKRKDG